jgi:hypothetical protein
LLAMSGMPSTPPMVPQSVVYEEFAGTGV